MVKGRVVPNKDDGQVINDIQIMRKGFYDLCAKLAMDNGVPVDELMSLLKEVSEDMYTAGLDRVFATAPLSNHDNVADAFDFTWLAMLAVRLNNYNSTLLEVLNEGICPNCGGLIAIRNPTSKCDHLYYPEYVKKG